jgi:hypothetical protein
MSMTGKDYTFLGNHIRNYTAILKRASSLLKTSVKFRPPVLHVEDGIAESLGTWTKEYEHASMVLEHCRNEFRLLIAKDRRGGSITFVKGTKKYATFHEDAKVNPAMWLKCEDFKDPTQRQLSFFWREKIRKQELIFLENIIDEFVKLIAHDNPQTSNLNTYVFEQDVVSEWVKFYEYCRERHRGNTETKTVFKFPVLPESIMWKPTEEEQNDPAKYSLRNWDHTRACLAFHKAVKVEQLRTDIEKNTYKVQNHVTLEDNRYFVLGMSMSNAL